MPLTTHDLIEQLSAAHYRFLSLWPGAVRTQTHGALLVGNRLVPIPFRSHATLVRARPDQVEGLIRAARGFFTGLGALPAFQLDPETWPADLPAALVRAGFQPQVEESWMTCDPATAGQGINGPALQIEPLTAESSPAAVQAYVDCYNTSFRTPESTWAGMGESFRGVLRHRAGRHYLAHVGDEPAGSMSLFAAGGLGCVYNVGTFAAFRGQGIATSLLLHLFGEARRLKVHTLFLQAVHQGPAQPLYQRLGFQTAFVRAWYLPDAPGGIWSRSER
jgi:ribosomal protein S18 acetylase RimI-like enzyme